MSSQLYLCDSCYGAVVWPEGIRNVEHVCDDPDECGCLQFHYVRLTNKPGYKGNGKGKGNQS